MDTLLVALVVAVIGPVLLAYLTNRSRRQDKQEDWARQDAVAAQAAEAARLLLERQDAVAAQAREAARLLLDSNERVAETAAVTNGKLDVIHTLVNSNMTAAMQAELDATTRELAMMREVIALNKAAGRQPSTDALAAIESTTHKIRELEAALADRLQQTHVVEAQAKAQAQALKKG